MKYGIYTVLATLAWSTSSEKIRYDGYTVQRITPQNEKQLAALNDLENLGAKFWDEPSTVGRHADVLMPPHLTEHLSQRMKKLGMKVESMVEDVQRAIDLEESSAVRSPDGRLTWTQYATVDQINSFLNEQHQIHPETTTVHTIGTSYQGRDLVVFGIHGNSSAGTRPAIWVDSNMHAREWITSAVSTYLINELLNGGAKAWTDDFDWYIMPMVNPDGHNYTKTTNRLWRKTRSINQGSSCIGTDPNRNFGFHWGEGGSSTNPCSETYAGSAPFSELRLYGILLLASAPDLRPT